MKRFVFLVDLSTLEPFLLGVLARVDLFGEDMKRVNHFNNIFSCNFDGKAEPGPEAYGIF